MKLTITLFFIAFSFCTVCVAQKNKVTYEFPPEMKDAVRADYIKQWEKGKVLYEINCAKCHNTVEKRRVIVPDFTPEQLRGYELRVTNAKHESEITETAVSTEELGIIMTFLSYKKKNK
jgi:hypothetical protein